MEVLDKWGQLLAPKGGFDPSGAWQAGLLLFLLLVCARLFKSRKAAADFDTYSPRLWLTWNRSFAIFWVLSSAIYLILGPIIGIQTDILRFFFYLGGAWIVIGLLSALLREKFWAESVAFVAYLITGIFGLALVEDSIRLLEEMSFSVGSVTISAWGVLAGIIAFAFTLWVGLAVSRIIEGRVKTIPKLSGSLKVLIAKIVRIVSIFIATMIAVSSMGVDLSALTVLGGALGLGLGFGLQKVVSNFVSGIILLLDNSIKPGDVIEIDGTYGWINNLRARYASVITRDGTEHLIPNEDLITQRVINWSFTDNLVRVREPIGVSYKSDPHQCIQLVLEAANSTTRVLKNPGPNCLLNGFGDSSVDLELRIWLADPSNGIGAVRSEVLLKIWDTFKENGIEIPFPQRDLHIRSSSVDFVKREQPDPE
jgi:small-conductance mechanosensitive channel